MRTRKGRAKAMLKEFGINILVKDIESVKTEDTFNVGHAGGFRKYIKRVTMKNGDVYRYSGEPESKYSGLFVYKLLDNEE